MWTVLKLPELIRKDFIWSGILKNLIISMYDSLSDRLYFIANTYSETVGIEKTRSNIRWAKSSLTGSRSVPELLPKSNPIKQITNRILNWILDQNHFHKSGSWFKSVKLLYFWEL